MVQKIFLTMMLPYLMLILFGCKEAPVEERSAMQKKVDEFVEVELSSELITGLTTKEKGFIREGLRSDPDRISEAGIPRDIRFHQGMEVVGL